MKKLIVIIMVLFFAGVCTTFGQNKDATEKKVKQDQSTLENNFYLSYGLGSLYYFINTGGLNVDGTSGTILLGYSRSLNKVVAIGFQLSYSNLESSGHTSGYAYTTTKEQTDNLWQGMANVRFQYLNRPSFCIYSGIGIGVTMDYYSKTENQNSTHGQNLWPAGQFTLLGFRIGHALSFFGEFGIGTNSIMSGGISYKFGDNF